VCNPEAAGGDALKFIERVLDADRQPLDHAYIVPLSDLHIGDPGFDENKFLAYRKWIMDNDAWVIINGDMGNYATKDSISDTYSATLTPNQQIDKTVELFQPIKDRVLAWNDGNHDARLYKSAGVIVGDRATKELGIAGVYSGEGSLVKVCLGKDGHSRRVVYTIYATHGHGGGRKTGGKANNLEDMANIVFADCYVASHTHQVLAFPKTFFVPDLHNNTITEVKQTFVSAGSFLKWGGYAEAKGYNPAKLGSPRIRLDGKRKDVHVSI
jgi:predicted phosphodiesterase